MPRSFKSAISQRVNPVYHYFKYGLFAKKYDPATFLPPEVMRIIFGMLGNANSLLDSTQVCKKWHQILHSENFLHLLQAKSLIQFYRTLTDITIAKKITDNAKVTQLEILLLGIEPSNIKSPSFKHQSIELYDDARTFCSKTDILLGNATYQVSRFSFCNTNSSTIKKIIYRDSIVRVITIAYISCEQDVAKYHKLIYPTLPTVLIFATDNETLAKEIKNCVVLTPKFAKYNRHTLFLEWILILQQLEAISKQYQPLAEKLQFLNENEKFNPETKIWHIRPYGNPK